MGEQPLDGLFHLLRRGHPESLGIVCGGGHAGDHHSHGGVEVSLLSQNSYPAALQHIWLSHLAGTGVVTSMWTFLLLKFFCHVTSCMWCIYEACKHMMCSEWATYKNPVTPQPVWSLWINFLSEPLHIEMIKALHLDQPNPPGQLSYFALILRAAVTLTNPTINVVYIFLLGNFLPHQLNGLI